MSQSSIQVLTANQLVALLRDQAANMAEVGEILFGEKLNQDSVIHSMEELARVATMYAAELRSRAAN